MEFTKEKTLMPDGRYLIYYGFDPGAKTETGTKPEKGQLKNQTKGEQHV